jgi:hypothetical protein
VGEDVILTEVVLTEVVVLLVLFAILNSLIL